MKSTELRDWADRPVALSHATPSARSTKTIAFSASPLWRPLDKLPFSSHCGGDAERLPRA